MTEFKISGIKCDNCSYRDDTVTFEQYPDYINKGCPLCGTNLLTEEEYFQCIRMYKAVEKIDRFFHNIRWINPMFYWRKILGDNRKLYKHTYEFPKRK